MSLMFMTQKPKRQPPTPGRESLSRREIVRRMQDDYLDDLGLTNKIVTQVMNAFIEVYKECVLENKRVEIRNFGVLQRELLKGREIKHPETGELIPARPYYRIAFKPSASFKELLKQKAKEEAQKL